MNVWMQRLFACAVLLGANALAETAGALRAGAARVDISPPRQMLPFKLGSATLANVHDPLYARALVLDNQATRVALISVDTTMLPNGDEMVKAVAEELKVPTSHVSVAGTHDHSSPTAGPPGPRGAELKPYLDLMLKGVVQAAHDAKAHLEPARLGFGTGKAYVNTNRDEKVGDRYQMGFQPEGPSDKTVTVIKVTKPGGEPIAVWANYPVHSVVMYLSKTKDDQAEITGDLAGWTERYVEDHFPGAVAVWTMGPAGDQNPLYMSLYNQMGPETRDQGANGWALLDVQSRRLGEEIVRVAKSIANTTDKAVLWGKETTVSCPGRVRNPNGAGMVDGDPVSIHLSLIMINDIALPNVTGEVFTEIWQKLKRASLFDRTAMVTLSGGTIGYIPSENAFALPSQMAANNRLKPGCAEAQVVNTLLQMEQAYVPVWTAAK